MSAGSCAEGSNISVLTGGKLNISVYGSPYPTSLCISSGGSSYLFNWNLSDYNVTEDNRIVLRYGVQASNITIEKGIVSVFGGKLNGCTIKSGGQLTLSSGAVGDVNNIIISSRGLLQNFLGYISSATISSGGSLIMTSGVISYATALSGCYLSGASWASIRSSLINCSATINKGNLQNCVLGGNVQISSGSAVSTTIKNNGHLVFYGTNANNISISSGGSMSVIKGRVNSITVNSAGWLTVSSGAVVSSAEVFSSGNLLILSKGTAYAVASHTGASIIVSSGGTITYI